jgi:hypothetical protein
LGTHARLDTAMSIQPGKRFTFVYLRAAQAYMLISMPTGTSTILGVFQVIPSSEVIRRELRAGVETRSTSDSAQVRKIEHATPIFHSWINRLLSWTKRREHRDIVSRSFLSRPMRKPEPAQ